MVTSKPSLIITTGEPAGIGPELAVKLAQQPLAAEVLFLGDPVLLRETAKTIGLPLHLQESASPRPHKPQTLTLYPIPLAKQAIPGQPTPANANYVLAQLDTAISFCLKKRNYRMVTAPLDKSIINEAGIPFTGHTSYLASKTQSQTTMMLASSALRVTLVTCHIPLKAIFSEITATNLIHTIQATEKALIQNFHIPHPQIGILGLNPHAGEKGVLGAEENTLIIPVLKSYPSKQATLHGPLPPDSAFIPALRQKMDAYVALYHDQGLIPIKTLSFEDAVNITLGLPFIRTSVDHGTAYDIAGKNCAKVTSLLTAIQMASELSHD